MKDKHIFILPAGRIPCTNHINTLDPEKKWRVTIEPFRKRRSLEQNSYLHGVPMKIISDHTGYDMEDLKTYLMGQAFGWEEYEIFGKMRKRPRLTTSQLNTEQFAWFVEWLIAWASQELGLVIPLPNEDLV